MSGEASLYGEVTSKASSEAIESVLEVILMLVGQAVCLMRTMRNQQHAR
jgi:hypothetical protein